MLKVCKLFLFITVFCFIAACDRAGSGLSFKLDENCPDFIVQQGDDFIIKHGKLRMQLKPMIGGRVASLKYGEQEILLASDQSDSLLWGSVLWSSPQEDWDWPPVETLDSKPYKVSVGEDQLVFTSEIDSKTGYQFVKTYSVIPDSEALRLGYRIYNHNNEPKSVAPWEVTRVPPMGTTIFPKGFTGFDASIFYPLPIEIVDGIVWFPYDRKKLEDDHHKLMTDSQEGWLAYTHRGYLFVKQFADVPVNLIAPGEGEIELYTNTHMDKGYLELEQQGEITILQPGEYLEWEVIWHLKKLPADISADIGNPDLVAYIRKLVNSH